MGRHKKADDQGRVEFLKALILMTETGYPVTPSVARDAYGVCCRAALEDGWFWIPCAEQAAKDIRRRGLRAVGTLTTTFIPRQMPVELDVSCTPEEIPIVGTQAHAELMLEETRARRAGLLP